MSRSSLAFAVPFVALAVASSLGACAGPPPPPPLAASTAPRPPPGQSSPTSQVTRIPSKDGTLIALECVGAGPSLVFVHGGVGDRTRWTPLFPAFSSRFTVCAMDRRGHGASADSADYTLQKEAEDVVAVVDSRPGPVFVLGHSYGGVAALEAAFLTNRISKLVLYEPPVQDHIDLAVPARMEKLIKDGDSEQALIIFLQEIVTIPPSEVAVMRTKPRWPGLVATVGSQIRQLRALAAYRFDAKRMGAVKVPTLLVTGGETASKAPHLAEAINSLSVSLPHATVAVIEGQGHNAMDTGREKLADAVVKFLLPH